MSLFVTYHIDVTIVLFCRACITHSTPSLSMLFSDNLTQEIREQRQVGVVLRSIRLELKCQIKRWAKTNTVFSSCTSKSFARLTKSPPVTHCS